MTKNKKLKDLTLSELETKQTRYRGFVNILCVATLFTLVLVIYFSIKSDNYIYLTLCGIFSFALLLSAVILKQVETEIGSRELNSYMSKFNSKE